MKLTRTYNFDLKNIEQLSHAVYHLDKESRIILGVLAKNGNLSQTKIAEKTGNGEKHVPISTVRRKLIGAPATLGLISHGFLYEKQVNKRRYGKQEKTYYLTLKGMLSALPSGVPIKKFQIFNRYINFLSTFINDQNIIRFIEECILSEIQFFLTWHAFQGINLTKQRSNNFYMNHFLKFKIRKHDFQYFPFVSKREYEWYEDAIKLKVEFNANKIILDNMIEHGILPAPSIQFDTIFDNPESDMNFDKKIISGETTFFIKQWPILMDTLQESDYEMEKLKLNDILTPKPRLGRDYEKRVRHKVVKRLMKFGLKVQDLGKLGEEFERDELSKKIKSGHYSKSVPVNS
ncbi:MAG: hypothetical protein COY74_09385 [Nitrosopumilales archaeon CG_4_10_14_0_8_um_filter_34_8]|nr:MAG: hypothetical protein COY74_09385 [Nitrosopumilales archaeon CG_4_10_14_0_8_um_filter_34_8]PJB96292.1 MAG: hypothetical protein CO079_10275 [Nitrosopumilales archaeon CG_4_9_14_0_8_um_filter_34_10]